MTREGDDVDSARHQMTSAVIARRAADELVLLDTEHDRVYGVEGVGARILELLEVPHSVEEIVEVLLLEYEVDAATLRQDVQGFVRQLRASSLIERVERGVG